MVPTVVWSVSYWVSQWKNIPQWQYYPISANTAQYPITQYQYHSNPREFTEESTSTSSIVSHSSSARRIIAGAQLQHDKHNTWLAIDLHRITCFTSSPGTASILLVHCTSRHAISKLHHIFSSASTVWHHLSMSFWVGLGLFFFPSNSL